VRSSAVKFLRYCQARIGLREFLLAPATSKPCSIVALAGLAFGTVSARFRPCRHRKSSNRRSWSWGACCLAPTESPTKIEPRDRGLDHALFIPHGSDEAPRMKCQKYESAIKSVEYFMKT
jgi:hypothetical protein